MTRHKLDSRLVLATHNPSKIREMQALLAHLDTEILPARTFCNKEPEETGRTFHENAALKAQHYANLTGLPSLADDSGLVVPVLDGAPGIFSARWAVMPDGQINYEAAYKRLEKALAEKGALPEPEAHLQCVVCLAWPDGHTAFFEGKLCGYLTFPPRGEGGFGYDPLFIPKGFDITCSEMTSEIKNKISHRFQALQALQQYLKDAGE